ncbi:MAG: PAS domain S-box protein [Deltaproteobacteria bacterium]|nr:PAS domain S-box protein [Deltaproteobacteria bacterium]
MSDAMKNQGDNDAREPTILIIDDDPNNLAMMTSFLEDRNFSILVAEDSESGLKRAHYARPDLILLDILLPQIDGYETCRRLKAMESTKEIPVIFMTALAETEHKIKGFAAGAVDYITKPFQREEVLARVGVHLRIRELTNRLREEKELLERRVEERTAALGRANKALCESEKKYRTLIETTRDLVFIVDRRGMFTYANPRLEVLTGYSTHELTGRPFTDTLASESREAAVEQFRRGIRGEVTLPYEVEIIHKTGAKTPVEFLTTTLFDLDGKPVGRFGVGRDMTDRKRTEEELLRMNTFLDSIVENIPNMIFLKDAMDLRFVRFNRAGEDLLGHSRDDLLGKSDYDFFPKEQADFFTEKDRDVLHRKEIVEIPEERIQTHSKGERILHTKKVPILNVTGEAEYLLGISEDITERKRAETAQSDSERRLSDIIDFLPDATLAIDENKRIIIWTRAIEEMTGIPAEEMIGKGEYAYTIPFYGVARPQLMDLFWEPAHEIAAKYPLLQREGENLVIEVFCPALYGGKGAFVWAKASPLRDTEGRLIGAIECIRDITERKQAEEALRRSEANYRSVIENIQDVFYRSDVQGNLIMASPSFLTLLGYESLAECLGRPIAGTFYYDPEKRAEFLRQVQEKGSVTNYEVDLKRRDGTPVTVETNSHFYFDDAGNIVGVEGVFRDITGRKQAEEERSKLESQLIQAQKMEAVGTLAGGIAHDFNNILSGIMGYSELCLKAVQDRPKVHHHMEQVLKAAERARDLVRQILTFSRKAEQEKKPIALAPIVKEVFNFMRASLPTTIEITQKIEETADVIMADPTQMHQVLINLCTNAGHAMRETGGVLEIGLEEVVINADDRLHRPPIRHGHYLVLTVRDTGQGIPQENLERIFEPYFTTKEKGEGTGLGLAVVHGIAKDHGGEIRVYSEVGKGTIFRVYLPLMEKQKEGGKDIEEALLPGKGETILFIDDEKMVAELSKDLLEELGYRVVTETDPVKAIEVFKESRDTFDLVITDKTMPHLTGFDVAGEIRRIRTDIPIVLCSGLQEKGDLEKLTTLGINRLITKPIRMSALANAIREVLDKKQPLG